MCNTPPQDMLQIYVNTPLCYVYRLFQPELYRFFQIFLIFCFLYILPQKTEPLLLRFPIQYIIPTLLLLFSLQILQQT